MLFEIHLARTFMPMINLLPLFVNIYESQQAAAPLVAPLVVPFVAAWPLGADLPRPSVRTEARFLLEGTSMAGFSEKKSAGLM